jgi:hypothetical protein
MHSSNVLPEEYLGKEVRAALVKYVSTSNEPFVLDRIGPSVWRAVCVLTPYQDRVSDESAYAKEINGILRSSAFVANESHWALVFVGDGASRVIRVKRGRELDLMGHKEAMAVIGTDTLMRFELLACAPRNNAYLLVVRRSDRGYVTLGRKR